MEHHGGGRVETSHPRCSHDGGRGVSDPRLPIDVDVDVDLHGDDEVERSLSDKPVLEWTTDDWRRWTESHFPTSELASRATPAVAAEPEAAATSDEWWLERPRPPIDEAAVPFVPEPPVPEPPVPEPPVPVPHVDVPRTNTTLALPPLEPGEAHAVVVGTRSAPAHRRRPRPSETGSDHRIRSAVGLLATSLLVGAVVASLVTVMLFVLSLVLQKAID